MVRTCEDRWALFFPSHHSEPWVLGCDWLMECFTQQPLCRPAQVPASAGRGSVGPAAPAGVGRDEDGGRYYSTKRGAFHEVFNLPESERPLTGEGGTAVQVGNNNNSPIFYFIYFFIYNFQPLPGERQTLRLNDSTWAAPDDWSFLSDILLVFFLVTAENGWRCCLINRDRKTPTDYIRNGILYITEKWVLRLFTSRVFTLKQVRDNLMAKRQYAARPVKTDRKYVYCN